MGEGRDALFSAHGLVHPAQHLSDPGVHSVGIWTCATHSPADQTSQEPPAAGLLTGQWTSRIALEKGKEKWCDGDPPAYPAGCFQEYTDSCIPSTHVWDVCT